jgi:hypothetical protein
MNHLGSGHVLINNRQAGREGTPDKQCQETQAMAN